MIINNSNNNNDNINHVNIDDNQIHIAIIYFKKDITSSFVK